MGSLHVRFPAVLCVMAILSFQNVKPAENWKTSSSEKGVFKWATFCDWEGNNFDEIQDVSTADNCGNFCLADLKCTHFSWVDETCFLKEFTTPTIETTFEEVASCGFVVRRISGMKENTSPNVRTMPPTTTVATSAKTSTPTTESTIQTTTPVATSTKTSTPTTESTIQTTSQSSASTTDASIQGRSPSAKFSTATVVQETSMKGPEIMWASKCQFTTKGECGKLCLSGAHCTHFLWIKGICFLNAETKIMPETKTNQEEEPECGYVANRNEKPGDRLSTSEQIVITSKDTWKTSTVTTQAPTTPMTTLPELDLSHSISTTTYHILHKPAKKPPRRGSMFPELG